MIERLLDVRNGLERKRDRIDAQLELINQLIELEGEGDPEEGGPEPASESGAGRIRKVVKRRRRRNADVSDNQESARSGRLPPPRPDTPHRSRATGTPTRKGPEADIPPTKCGDGTIAVVEDSNMDKVVSAIRGRAPHWVSHDGIVEAADAMGLNTPKTFRAIVHQICAQLRKGKHAVPGLEYRTIGRRVEYRMPVINLTEEE